MANTLFIEKYIRRNSKTPPNDQQNLNSYLTELIYACTHLSQNGLRLKLIAEPHTLRKFGNPSIREIFGNHVTVRPTIRLSAQQAYQFKITQLTGITLELFLAGNLRATRTFREKKQQQSRVSLDVKVYSH